MDEAKIIEMIHNIKPTDKAAGEKARQRLLNLAKPPGSLGRLEDIAVQLAEITGNVHNTISKKCVIIMSSDNGVVEEGVASAPQEVTYSQTINFTRGLTGVAVLAKQYQTDLMVIDVGINAEINHPGIINRKIRKSTNNIAKEPAMTREEAVQAVAIGIEAALEAAEKGYDILGVGEMGIGNTTTTSAVFSALTGISTDLCVGRGAGIDNDGFAKKKAIIRTAIERFQPDQNDPIDIIAKVGGFDIGAMTGVFLGAAMCRKPVVIDGYISVVAALCASKMSPYAKEYMIASHASYEIGYNHAVQELGLEPSLHLNMRLGEGSGCPVMFSVIEGACAVINNMATFDEANIDDEYLEYFNGEDRFSV